MDKLGALTACSFALVAMPESAQDCPPRPVRMLVHPAVAAKSVADLVAIAKNHTGSIDFASSGTGATAHLCSELMKSMPGIDIVPVPYKATQWGGVLGSAGVRPQ